MNPDATSEMFEEVKLLLTEIKKTIEKQQTNNDIQEVSKQPTDILDDEIIHKIVDPISEVYQLNMVNMINCLDNQQIKTQKTLNSTVEEISDIIREDTHQYHHHNFEFKSSKVVITFIMLFLMFLGSFVYNIIQNNENRKIQNNDIKYRCIKVMGGIGETKLYELESIFNNSTNKKKQDEIIQEVIDHETKIQKRAEEIEQANLKEEQAKKLLNESELIRKKR